MVPVIRVKNLAGSAFMHLRREISTSQSGHERRTMRRFDMRLPATVRVAGLGLRDLSTETQNVSARGVFFYLDRPLAEGARIEVTMTFPPHVTLTEPVRVRFTARVVRIESLQTIAGVGVAAMIEEYEFLRSSSASEFSDGRFAT
jgi:PilZ domain